MRKFCLLFSLVCLSQIAMAIDGNDDNVTRDYYVELYKTQRYIPDFDQVFANANDRSDYRKLRDYLNRKKEIERLLRMAGDEYYYGLSFSRLFAEDYVQSLEDDMVTRDPGEKILIRLNSVMPNIRYNGEYTVAFVQSSIIPTIKEKYQAAIVKDSLNQATYTQIQESLEGVQTDVFKCEQALNAALAPEFQQQSFRIWVSATFSALIAVLLCAFFFIMYKRSDKTLARNLLSETGLQFITIFVLIIAIVLFGILDVLGGSELAAILSGISGYILGKSGQMLSERIKDEPIAMKLESQAIVSEPLPTATIENEEKYLPGENLMND